MQAMHGSVYSVHLARDLRPQAHCELHTETGSVSECVCDVAGGTEII